MIISTGIEPRVIAPAEYHAIGNEYPRGDKRRTMSRSDLKTFAKNPRKWLKGFSEKDSDATDWGSLVDCLALTPAAFESLYAVAPQTYAAKGKKKEDPDIEKPWNWNATVCSDWRDAQEASGKICIRIPEIVAAQEAASGLSEAFREILGNAESQMLISAAWKDSATGLIIPLRCLADIVPAGSFLADLKTTSRADLESWVRTVFKFGYDMQAAMYLDCYNAATEEERRVFYHLVQESDPPYETAFWMMSEEFIGMGRGRYQKALRDYCRCLTDKEWPGYEREASHQFDGAGLIDPTLYMMSTNRIED